MEAIPGATPTLTSASVTLRKSVPLGRYPRTNVRRELAFFRGNRHRMHYADAAAAGHAIGSASVEAANSVLVTARMKRSGQGLGRDGGQGVPAFRSLPGPGRLHRAWAALVPRLSRSGGWRPPECANGNRPVGQVARAP